MCSYVKERMLLIFGSSVSILFLTLQKSFHRCFSNLFASCFVCAACVVRAASSLGYLCVCQRSLEKSLWHIVLLPRQSHVILKLKNTICAPWRRGREKKIIVKCLSYLGDLNFISLRVWYWKYVKPLCFICPCFFPCQLIWNLLCCVIHQTACCAGIAVQRGNWAC